jgi:uncharacterized MAPEG superfamily protein
METKKIGRPQGAKNKLSGQAKENIQAVFVRLGGTAAMAKWAEDNQTEFYRIYSRLLPHEVSGTDGGPIQVAASWLAGRSV